jgi:hypothetical protein
MSCTYDVTTDIGLIRMAIGDTDCTTAQLSDEEIMALLALVDTWQEAALRAVDTLIARYAMASYDMRLGPRAESLSQRIENLKALRAFLAGSYGLEGTALLSSLGSEDLAFSWNEEEEEDDYSGVL